MNLETMADNAVKQVMMICAEDVRKLYRKILVHMLKDVLIQEYHALEEKGVSAAEIHTALKTKLKETCTRYENSKAARKQGHVPGTNCFAESTTLRNITDVFNPKNFHNK